MEGINERNYGDKDPWKKAAGLGLHLVESDDRHLQVDLDTEKQKEEFPCRLRRMADVAQGLLHEPPRVLLTTSKGGGQHAYVKLAKPVRDGMRRCLLALELGSDPAREGLALVRLKVGEWPVCLFETGEEILRVKEFLASE